MQMQFYRALTLAALVGVCAPASALAGQAGAPAGQGPQAPATNAAPAPSPDAQPPAEPGAILTTAPCSKQPIAAPAAAPPAGMAFVWTLELCFDKQDNSS